MCLVTNKKRATFLRSLRLSGAGFATDPASTGSPKSVRSWKRYDNLMTQLLYLGAPVASNGTSVSLNASSLSSCLNPGVVNGFTLLPSSPRSLSTSSACLMSGSILTCLLPSEFVPTDTTTQRGVHSDSQNQVGVILAWSTCQIRFCPSGPTLDASQPQQSRLRELRLGNVLLHCRTKRDLPHQRCTQLVQTLLANLFASLHLLYETRTSTAKVNQLHHRLLAVCLPAEVRCMLHDPWAPSNDPSAPGTSSLTRSPNNTLKLSHGGIALKSSCASTSLAALFQQVCISPLAQPT